MKIFISTIIFLPLLSSCFVMSSGSVGSGPLLNINDRPVGVSTGAARAITVMGLGGFHRDQLLQDAKSAMFQNYRLQEQQYYANITSNINTKFVLGGIVVVRRAVVSAEIMSQAATKEQTNVQGNLSTQSSSLSVNTNASRPIEPGLQKMSLRGANRDSFFVCESDTFFVGDVVYGNIGKNEAEYVHLQILQVEGKRVRLRYLDQIRTDEKLRYAYYRFFSASRSYNGFSSGEKVVVNSLLTGRHEGIVLGLNLKYALVKFHDMTDYYPLGRLEHLK